MTIRTPGTPEPITKLIDALSRLPGIGPKSASRITFFLLRAPDDLSRALAEAVADLKAKTRLCSICFNITDIDPCAVCSDPQRDAGVIAVVEEPLDALAIERTGIYKGRYHVLHGALSPVEGIGPDQIRVRELVARIKKGDVQELIIATNPGMEGDATAMYIQRELHGDPIKITRLARGLPTGGDIEYVDPITLIRAMEGRQVL